LLVAVDAVVVRVLDLDAVLAFYRRAGPQVVWRTDRMSGLRLAEGATELVLAATS
jgi:catechol 2,3-dioxygenase-like lactoylglutathione lyase family enzyme